MKVELRYGNKKEPLAVVMTNHAMNLDAMLDFCDATEIPYTGGDEYVAIDGEEYRKDNLYIEIVSD